MSVSSALAAFAFLCFLLPSPVLCQSCTNVGYFDAPGYSPFTVTNSEGTLLVAGHVIVETTGPLTALGTHWQQTPLASTPGAQYRYGLYVHDVNYNTNHQFNLIAYSALLSVPATGTPPEFELAPLAASSPVPTLSPGTNYFIALAYAPQGHYALYSDGGATDTAFYEYDFSGTENNIPVSFVLSDLALDFQHELRYCTSSVSGDPQFVGLRGQSYQVHGVDGEIYNLVSSSTTQVNSRFVFLFNGECPIFNGIPAKNCWSHPGSYLGEIGIQQVVGDKIHQLTIIASDAKNGFASILLNGEPFKLGSSVTDGNLFAVNYTTTHYIRVQTEEFVFDFDNSDKFINQAVTARIPLAQLKSHGLFGQTHEKKISGNVIKYIAGDVDDYVVSDNNLFGKNFVYNQFQL